MKLSAPHFITWLVAVIIGAIAILAYFRILNIGALAPYTFHMIAAAFALLVLAGLIKKL